MTTYISTVYMIKECSNMPIRFPTYIVESYLFTATSEMPTVTDNDPAGRLPALRPFLLVLTIDIAHCVRLDPLIGLSVSLLPDTRPGDARIGSTRARAQGEEASRELDDLLGWDVSEEGREGGAGTPRLPRGPSRACSNARLWSRGLSQP